TDKTSEIRSFSINSHEEPEVPLALPLETDTLEEKHTDIEAVKGTSTVSEVQSQLGYCKYRYNETTGNVTRIRCKLAAPTVPRINHVLTENVSYWIDTTVQIPQKYDLFIEHTICKPKTIRDPRTWFNCSEIIKETNKKTVEVRGSI